MTQLRSIQALRAVAALAVFLCHLIAIEEGQAERSGKLTDFWINGAHGVDLFFVISGFIMVWVAADMQRGIGAAGSFLYARITRIYPLWWLFATTMVLFLLVGKGVPWEVERLEPAGLEGSMHLIKSFLLLPQPIHPVLGVGWTLVHEMYFYLGFALLIVLLPARWRLYGLLTWGLAVFIGGLAGLSGFHAGDPVQLIFHPLTLQFVAGALAGYAIKAGWRQLAGPCALIGALGFVAVFLDLDKAAVPMLESLLNMTLPEWEKPWRRTFAYGLPAALLVYGLVALELGKGFGRYIPDFMVALGDWSYSLYLCHVITISVAGRVAYKLLSPENPFGNAAFLVLCSIVTVLTAALTYRFFERPSIRFFRKWHKP